MKRGLRLVHYTSPEAAASIREYGFLESYRNPVLIGFSFARAGETWPRTGMRPEAVHAVFDGNLVDPCDVGDRPSDVYGGTTGNAQWNDLVRQVARKVRLDWRAAPTPAWWLKRRRFATLLRKELRARGIDAFVSGAEIVVVDPAKLRILRRRSR